jgi:hypothetical protein
MVLDAKALTWAGKNNIDTAKLKAGKVPIYGKWYFPEIPYGVALLNLETGEQKVFAERMVAGEVIWVPTADLKRAGLLPEGVEVMTVPTGIETVGRGARAMAPEPLLAMARPPGFSTGGDLERLVADVPELSTEDAAVLSGLHMPRPSIAPFVLGIGFCIVMLGAITHWIILVVGLAWMLAGAIGWIRIGLLESRAAAAHGSVVEAEHST